mmetsp:Transcript_127377/g.271560  ORF Transcript_127377/g.271560 Transcript_127377/m.271560 type:complete len:200 (-) Transcript_127377:48-647(-)
MSAAAATFDQLDTNHDGVLSREEFAAMGAPTTLPAVYMTAPASSYMVASPMAGPMTMEAVPTYDGTNVTYVSPYVYIAPPVYLETVEAAPLTQEVPVTAEVPVIEEVPGMEAVPALVEGQYVTMSPEGMTQPITYMTPSNTEGAYTTIIVHPPVTVPPGTTVEEFMAGQTVPDTVTTTTSEKSPKKMKISKKKKAVCCF